MLVGEVLVGVLGRRRGEHVRQERREAQQHEPATVRLIEHFPDSAVCDRPLRERGVPAGLEQVATQRRKEEQCQRAQPERDPPRLWPEVGDRQRDDRDREPASRGEREHRQREGTRTLRCFFDNGDAAHHKGGIGEGPSEHLTAGEDLEGG